MKNVVYSVNGPVVTVKNATDFSMMEMVYVGNKRLTGEVISINSRFTTIQVYETTTGLQPGEPVYSTGSPLSAELGPGILSNIFDGIQRPLKDMEARSGAFIEEGISVSSLDPEKKWQVTMKVREGDKVQPGQIFAACPETALIEHRALVPPM